MSAPMSGRSRKETSHSPPSNGKRKGNGTQSSMPAPMGQSPSQLAVDEVVEETHAVSPPGPRGAEQALPGATLTIKRPAPPDVAQHQAGDGG
jgi:hypothetical protein